MNVQEMHIEVEQSTQQVAANASRKFYSEELDWVLNKMMHRFIQLKLNPNKERAYRKDQLDVDGLRSLFVSYKEVPAFADITTQTRTKTILPADYMHLVEDSSVCIDTCGGKTVAGTLTSQAVTALKIPKSTKADAPYYENMVITVGSTTLNIPGDLADGSIYTGYQSKEDVLFLRSFILTKLRSLGLEVYWEYYDTLYYRDTLLIVGTHTASINIDDSDVTETSVLTVARTSYTGTDLANPRANRLTFGLTHVERSTPFYKTSKDSPLSELSGQNLYTYYNENFIVRTSLLSYIRKPKAISLSLSCDCEVDSAFHNTICDMATEYINNRVGNTPGFKLAQHDTETRVKL